MFKYNGTLIPIGGNENKGGDEFKGIDFIHEGILAHVVREAGGTDAKIVILPTASSIPDEVGEIYLEAFGKLGCTNLSILNIQSREQAEDPATISVVTSADCLMFSGGDQSKITKFIRDTSLHALMHERLKNDPGFVIAGTSAGAMMMSTEMIAGGSSSESLVKGNVRMKKGMGFVSTFVIDSHFVARGRFGRLTEAVARFPHLMGVGLAEDTGMIIKGNEFCVIGTGMVILFDASDLTHNNHRLLSKGSPMSLSNLTTHVLVNGDRFVFENKHIEVLPMNAKYI